MIFFVVEGEKVVIRLLGSAKIQVQVVSVTTL